MEWMLLPFKRYAEFNGRSRRQEYWMFTLLNTIVYIILFLLMFLGMPADFMAGGDPFGITGGDSVQFGAFFYIAAGLFGIYALAVFIPTLAVTIRRLHDRDLSGWLLVGLLVLSAIPIIGSLVSIGWIIVMCLPGTSGPNKYGPDPLAHSAATVFE